MNAGTVYVSYADFGDDAAANSCKNVLAMLDALGKDKTTNGIKGERE